MFNKKGIAIRYVIMLVLAVFALLLLITFFTGQWDKLLNALTAVEDTAIGNIP